MSGFEVKVSNSYTGPKPLTYDPYAHNPRPEPQTSYDTRGAGAPATGYYASLASGKRKNRRASRKNRRASRRSTRRMNTRRAHRKNRRTSRR